MKPAKQPATLADLDTQLRELLKQPRTPADDALLRSMRAAISGSLGGQSRVKRTPCRWGCGAELSHTEHRTHGRECPARAQAEAQPRPMAAAQG